MLGQRFYALPYAFLMLAPYLLQLKHFAENIILRF